MQKWKEKKKGKNETVLRSKKELKNNLTQYWIDKSTNDRVKICKLLTRSHRSIQEGVFFLNQSKFKSQCRGKIKNFLN